MEKNFLAVLILFVLLFVFVIWNLKLVIRTFFKTSIEKPLSLEVKRLMKEAKTRIIDFFKQIEFEQNFTDALRSGIISGSKSFVFLINISQNELEMYQSFDRQFINSMAEKFLENKIDGVIIQHNLESRMNGSCYIEFFVSFY